MDHPMYGRGYPLSGIIKCTVSWGVPRVYHEVLTYLPYLSWQSKAVKFLTKAHRRHRVRVGTQATEIKNRVNGVNTSEWRS